MSDFQKTVCTITNEDCYASSCEGCRTALRETERLEEESKARYEFTKTAKLKGHEYNCNENLTVTRIPPENIQQAISDFKIDPYIEYNEIDDEYLKDHYPEWLKTREIHKFPSPEKYLLGDGFTPLVVMFKNFAYVVAPVRHD